jgi:hypothetical protein
VVELFLQLVNAMSNEFRKIGVKSVLPKFAEIFSQNLLIYYTPTATGGALSCLELAWATLGQPFGVLERP